MAGRGIDALVNLGLLALLVASTLNGVTFEWGVLGTELTIRPDQLVLVCLMPVVALACVMGRFRIRLILFEWVVIALLVSNAAASLLFSPTRNSSLKGTLLLGCYAAMYVVVRQILANRQEWLPTATTWVCGLGIAQAAYSLVAVGLYALGYVIGGLHIGHLAEGSVATKGTFWEPNLLGAYLALIALFLTVRYIFRLDRKGGRTDLVGVFVTSLALPLTVTRAAGAAFVFGLLVMALIIWLFRGEIRGWRTRTGIIAVTLGCVVLLTATATNALVSSVSRYPNLLRERWMPISWIGRAQHAAVIEDIALVSDNKALVPEEKALVSEEKASVSERRSPTVGAEARRVETQAVVERQVTYASRSSVEGRMDAWGRAIEASRDRPILGHGTLAGTTIIEGGWWYSSLIQALYDTGLVGLLVMLWIHLAAIAYPLRTWRRTRAGPMSASILGFGIANAVLFLTSQFSSFWFVGFPWVFLGLSIGAVAGNSTRHGSPSTVASPN